MANTIGDINTQGPLGCPGISDGELGLFQYSTGYLKKIVYSDIYPDS